MQSFSLESLLSLLPLESERDHLCRPCCPTCLIELTWLGRAKDSTCQCSPSSRLARWEC